MQESQQEYQILRVPFDSEMLQAADVINSMALNGWETVSVTCSAAAPEAVFITLRRAGQPPQNTAKPADISNDDRRGETELLLRAAQYAMDKGQISVQRVQSHFHIEFAKASRLVDALESNGIIEHSEGTLPRRVCISADDFASWKALMNRKADDAQ